ncbi:MAG: ATP-binding protein [Acidimicrobiaceae bacterium]|nr:ATP-binding protein [Acidimicrobiia bacterium]MCY4493857.1 ATP-binding protein [Acidimicrobiaceae bacterium]
MSLEEAMPPPSALLSFTASNVRSYRDEVNFSLLATRFARQQVRRELSTRASRTPIGVLPTAGVFGANASGKSTLLLALADMRAVVIGSFRSGTRSSGVYRRRFLLDDAYRSLPTRYEVELILHGVHWQYGFEVNDDRILGEYAYHYPHGRQAMVFDRTLDSISFGPPFRSSGRALGQLMRDNALFLSVVGAADDERLGPLFEWFHHNLLLAQANNRGARVVRTAEMVKEPDTKERVMALVRAADLGVCDIERAIVDPRVAEQLQLALRVLRGEEGNPEDSDHEIKVVFEDSVRLKHSAAVGDVELDAEFESLGTMVWVGLIGPVLDALVEGRVLLADELDASLHPHLVALLVEMFQDPKRNSRCAQLIFNAHDTSVLGDSEQSVLGRDQIWFAEKDIEGATTVYPLVEFRPRRDEALGRRYLQGRYGAVPVLDHGEIRAGLDLVDK